MTPLGVYRRPDQTGDHCHSACVPFSPAPCAYKPPLSRGAASVVAPTCWRAWSGEHGGARCADPAFERAGLNGNGADLRRWAILGCTAGPRLNAK
jgi:hypothetical protein